MPHTSSNAVLLRRLFTVAGWTVEEVPGGWRAQRKDGGATVLAYLEGGLPAGFQRHFPSDAPAVRVLFGHEPDAHDRDRVELTGAQVVSPDDVPRTVLALLQEPSTIGGGVASSDLPAQESGAAEVSRASSLRAASEAPPPPAETSPASPTGAATGVHLAPPTRKPLLLRRETALPRLGEDPSPFPLEVFETERIVRPRLHEHDLYQMAPSRWRGGTPRLILVPFHLFAYALASDEEVGGAPPRLVAVPLVGGAPQFWASGEREVVSALPHEPHRLHARYAKEETRRLAMEAVRERHARSEEMTERTRGALFIEHHRKALGEEEVRLGPPALVWVPHWVVEAWNGREVIDAVSGLTVDLPLETSELRER